MYDQIIHVVTHEHRQMPVGICGVIDDASRAGIVLGPDSSKGIMLVSFVVQTSTNHHGIKTEMGSLSPADGLCPLDSVE